MAVGPARGHKIGGEASVAQRLQVGRGQRITASHSRHLSLDVRFGETQLFEFDDFCERERAGLRGSAGRKERDTADQYGKNTQDWQRHKPLYHTPPFTSLKLYSLADGTYHSSFSLCIS